MWLQISSPLIKLLASSMTTSVGLRLVTRALMDANGRTHRLSQQYRFSR